MTTRRRWTLGSVAVLLAVVGAGAAWTTLRPRPTYNVAADGLALAGYDPVTYFPEGGGRPRPGDERWPEVRDGRRYRFVSAETRERFRADPARYEPHFGGWCAYAVAHGYKFEVDPESWMIVDGRLLLFYRGVMGDARTAFVDEDPAVGVRNADANWPRLAQEG